MAGISIATVDLTHLFALLLPCRALVPDAFCFRPEFHLGVLAFLERVVRLMRKCVFHFTRSHRTGKTNEQMRFPGYGLSARPCDFLGVHAAICNLDMQLAIK